MWWHEQGKQEGVEIKLALRGGVCSEMRFHTSCSEPSTIWVYLALLALLYVYREYFNSVSACLALSVCPLSAQCGTGRSQTSVICEQMNNVLCCISVNTALLQAWILLLKCPLTFLALQEPHVQAFAADQES